VWREKAAALALWVDASFQTGYVTVMVVAPHRRRRDALGTWTDQELRVGGFEGDAEMFAFTDVSPVDTPPVSFFCDAHWYPPSAAGPDTLIDLPPHLTQQRVEVGQ
jgi:hypothetical protein